MSKRYGNYVIGRKPIFELQKYYLPQNRSEFQENILEIARICLFSIHQLAEWLQIQCYKVAIMIFWTTFNCAHLAYNIPSTYNVQTYNWGSSCRLQPTYRKAYGIHIGQFLKRLISLTLSDPTLLMTTGIGGVEHTPCE